MGRQIFILLFTILPIFLASASSHDSSYNEAGCHVVVHVLEQESFNEGSRNIFSVYKSKVIDNLRCNRLHVGDTIQFAAPGGVFGNFETRINGIELEKGKDHYVTLSPAHERLGIPVLLSSQIIKRDLEAHKQPQFACSRVGSLGPSLYWAKRTVVIHPSISDNKSISQEDLIDAMRWAAIQWSQNSNSDFRFEIGEAVTQKWIGFDWSLRQKNYNIVVIRTGSQQDFYSEWLHESKAIAITSLTFIRQSGEIIDADIELNAAHFTFTNCEPGDNCLTFFDLKGTLTHEFGHMLGLDHPDPNQLRSKTTTMYEESALGETSKRTLSLDDLKGVEFLYPQGSPANECFGVGRKSPSNILILSQTGCGQEARIISLSPLLLLLILFFLRFAFLVYTRPNS